MYDEEIVSLKLKISNKFFNMKRHSKERFGLTINPRAKPSLKSIKKQHPSSKSKKFKLNFKTQEKDQNHPENLAYVGSSKIIQPRIYATAVSKKRDFSVGLDKKRELVENTPLNSNWSYRQSAAVNPVRDTDHKHQPPRLETGNKPVAKDIEDEEDAELSSKPSPNTIQRFRMMFTRTELSRSRYKSVEKSNTDKPNKQRYLKKKQQSLIHSPKNSINRPKTTIKWSRNGKKITPKKSAVRSPIRDKRQVRTEKNSTRARPKVQAAITLKRATTQDNRVKFNPYKMNADVSDGQNRYEVEDKMYYVHNNEIMKRNTPMFLSPFPATSPMIKNKKKDESEFVEEMNEPVVNRVSKDSGRIVEVGRASAPVHGRREVKKGIQKEGTSEEHGEGLKEGQKIDQGLADDVEKADKGESVEGKVIEKKKAEKSNFQKILDSLKLTFGLKVEETSQDKKQEPGDQPSDLKSQKELKKVLEKIKDSAENNPLQNKEDSQNKVRLSPWKQHLVNNKSAGPFLFKSKKLSVKAKGDSPGVRTPFGTSDQLGEFEFSPQDPPNEEGERKEVEREEESPKRLRTLRDELRLISTGGRDSSEARLENYHRKYVSEKKSGLDFGQRVPNTSLDLPGRRNAVHYQETKDSGL